MILRLDISVRLRDATSHVATALPARVATALLSTKVDKINICKKLKSQSIAEMSDLKFRFVTSKHNQAAAARR